MDDLIRRYAAIEVVGAIWAVTGDVNVAKAWDQINSLPSAQPEIIMCKECKEHNFCAIEDEARDETFFCKWGERRD